MDQPSSSAADEVSSLLQWINSTDGLQGWTTDGLATALDGLSSPNTKAIYQQTKLIACY